MTLFDGSRPKTKVQWVLGNQCNYHCSYCSEIFHKGDKLPPSKSLIAEVCKDITYHFDDLGRDVVFEFIGGEPTLSGDIKEIGMRLHNHPTSIILKTNGSADLEWWRKSKQYLTSVIISVHKEYCDLEHIDAVVTLLLEDKEIHPVDVEILIPTRHERSHWTWAIDALTHYRETFNLGNLQMLYTNFTRGSDTYFPYSNEQWHQYSLLHNLPIPKSKERLIDNQQSSSQNIETPIRQIDVKVRDKLDFNGYRCYAGIETLVIDYNGRVWRGWCAHGGAIGSIYELPIQFPTDPIVCGLSRCGNGFDQQSRKEH